MDVELREAIRRAATGDIRAQAALGPLLNRARLCDMPVGQGLRCMAPLDEGQTENETWCLECSNADAASEARHEANAEIAMERYYETRNEYHNGWED